MKANRTQRAIPLLTTRALGVYEDLRVTLLIHIPGGDEAMPLYLDEIYFDVPGKDGFKNLHDLIGSALKDGLPPSVTLKAGPFISNEEAKVILVLDIPDHSTTFGVFSGVVGKGLARKRRLTPIVDWEHFDKTMKDRK
jgi:hypothetical protein